MEGNFRQYREGDKLSHAVTQEYRVEFNNVSGTATFIKMEKCTPIQSGTPLSEFPAPYLASFRG